MNLLEIETKAELQHYALAFMDAHASLHVFDAWMLPVNLDNESDVAQLKAAMLADHFAMDVDDASSLDCFEGAVVNLCESHPNAQDGVAYRGTMKRWDVADGSCEPLPNEPIYEAMVKAGGPSNQIAIHISPPHTNPEEIDGMPQLSLVVEISGGLPCVHMHGDLYDGAVLQSIVALPGGVLEDRRNITPPNLVTIAKIIEELRTANATESAQARRGGEQPQS